MAGPHAAKARKARKGRAAAPDFDGRDSLLTHILIRLTAATAVHPTGAARPQGAGAPFDPEHNHVARPPDLSNPPPSPTARLAGRTHRLTELGLDLNTWKVLTESIFPTAKTAEGILLAVRYCQARGLDVLKRPVHVVPMWSRALGREVETVWPGINEVQVTAARTGQ